MNLVPRRWLLGAVGLGVLVVLVGTACPQPTPTPAPPTATPTKAAPTATPTTAVTTPVATPTTAAAATPTATPTKAPAAGPPKVPVAKGHIDPTPGLDCLMCHTVGGAGVGVPGLTGMPGPAAGANDHTGRTKDVCQTCHTK